MRTRVILHVDMDAFFVSVELLRRPELDGRPVVVGGTGRRGVVAAASYEARRYGVHSAMPSMRARRLCPVAVFLPGDYDAYAATSAAVFTLLGEFTPLVEPLSLDEAFLDVSGSVRLFGDGRTIAERIRVAIAERLSLACSVGVAANKFLAKMASVDAKPRANAGGVERGACVFEIRPGEEQAYLHPLPVRRLWGVGPATYERLSRLGVATIGDLLTVSPAALRGVLGPAAATRLADLARGIDDRPVEPSRPVKSVSHEETFAFDLHDRAEIRAHLARLADGVASRLRASGLGARTITLKVRDATFATVTRSRTLTRAVDTSAAILEVVDPLMETVTPSGGVRLLGVAAAKFAEPAEQLHLDGLGDPSDDPSAAIDRVRHRFGSEAIGSASGLQSYQDAGGARRSRLRVVRRGQQQWGADDD